MEVPVFQDNHEAQITPDVIYGLKQALTYMHEPVVRWDTADGESVYAAWPAPIDEASKHALENLHKLPDMPWMEWGEVLNTWIIECFSKNRVGDKPLRHEKMMLRAGLFMMHATVEFDPLDPDYDPEATNQELMAQLANHTYASSIEDYARLDNAVFDLKPITQEAIERLRTARLNMTDEEKWLERMAKFEWLVSPEMDKTKGPGWWTVSEMSMLYTVRASSPDEAAALVDKHHEDEDGMGILPFFFVERCTDDVSADFDKQFEHSKIVRLIPYSNVPYQEPGVPLTPEQEAAWKFVEELHAPREDN